MSTTFDWYMIRALGLVATGAFTVSAVLGASSVRGGRTPAAMDRRLIRQLVHRSTALIGLGALLGHLAFVLIDTYVPTSLSGLVIPFTAGYRPFALGLGSIALYALLLTAVSGWLRGGFAGRIGDEVWRRIHYAAYVGWALAIGHGFLAGSDSHRAWAEFGYLACVAAVAAAAAWRFLGAETDRAIDHAGRRRLIHRSAR
jgi:sulfoxide reductase heme-binding subunit YedZ